LIRSPAGAAAPFSCFGPPMIMLMGNTLNLCV
jgi:hypothetical protein